MTAPEAIGGSADLDARADEAELRTPSPPANGTNGAHPTVDPRPETFFAKSDLLGEKLGQHIMEEGHVQLGNDGRLYRFSRGVFRPDAETFVRSRTRELLGGRFKARHCEEALAWLRARFASVPERPPSDVLNVANGLLYWETLELRPHTPTFLSAIQLPVRWIPSAHCPLFGAFLEDVLPAAPTEFLYELFGYLAFTGNPFRVALLLLGPGRNGKSVLLRVLAALLGIDNISSVPLQTLAENRFAAAELYGRLANICGDLDARAIKHTDQFKLLTGGDRMTAERKHAPLFTFTPFAVPVFSANEAPISADQTEAWFDRWLILPMERRLAEDEVDPHLAEKLTSPAELEGILSKAVEGLRRVMDRGRFELPDVVLAGRDQYREQLDTVSGFLAEAAAFDLTTWTARSELYAGYRGWCERSGRLPVAAAKFYCRLRDSHGEQSEERIREGVRGFAGIRLRQVSQ